MSGQIPPYGVGFVLIRRDEYSPVYTQSIYRSREDADFEIWAEKGSKTWYIVFHGEPIKIPYPTLTEAMKALHAVFDSMRPK